MSTAGNLDTSERLKWLRARLEGEGTVRLAAAAAELDVSEMTIRRDLRELESLGLARRVRGGAVAVGPVAFRERHRHRAQAKGRIAAKLAPMVPSTGAIGLDASSTLLRLASSLHGGRGLIVLTSGPETFHALQDKPGLRAILTGGELDPRSGTLTGPVACRTASSLLLSRLFVSAEAVHAGLGTSEATMEEVEVKQAMASVAAEIVLAVDSSKLDNRSVALGFGWNRIAAMVTELDPADGRLDAYRELVELV